MFHHGSISDGDETDLSSPSSCSTPTDGLDSFIFDIPELMLPASSSPIDTYTRNRVDAASLSFSEPNSYERTSTNNNDGEEISFKQTLRKHSIPDQKKDEKYWKRRLRNNKSAKKSREAKRTQDDVVKNRMSFLETENNQLKMLVSKLLTERNNFYQNTPYWSCYKQ